MAFQMDSTRAAHFTDSVAAWPVGMVWSLGIRTFIPPPRRSFPLTHSPRLPLLTLKKFASDTPLWHILFFIPVTFFV